MDPLSTARYGMIAAENRFAASADRVARWGAGEDGFDPAPAMVDMVEAKQQFAASAKVVRFADEMWNALLKIQEPREGF